VGRIKPLETDIVAALDDDFTGLPEHGGGPFSHQGTAQFD